MENIRKIWKTKSICTEKGFSTNVFENIRNNFFISEKVWKYVRDLTVLDTYQSLTRTPLINADQNHCIGHCLRELCITWMSALPMQDECMSNALIQVTSLIGKCPIQLDL